MIQERNLIYDIRKKAHVGYKKERAYMIQERNQLYNTRKKPRV